MRPDFRSRNRLPYRRSLQSIEDCLSRDVLVSRNGSKDGAKGLVNSDVSPAAAEHIGQILPQPIARNFHATDSYSSS